MHVELQMDIALLQRAMKAETEAALLRAALTTLRANLKTPNAN